MSRATLLILLLAIVSLHAAAQKPPNRAVSPGDYVLRTDQVEYLARYYKTIDGHRMYRFTVTARFENLTQAPIYLDRCYPDTPYPLYSVGVVGQTKNRSSG